MAYRCPTYELQRMPTMTADTPSISTASTTLTNRATPQVAADVAPEDTAQLLQACEKVRVKVDDATLAARVWRNPGKPALLLVHGYPDNSDIWLPVISHLRASYELITYDVRGAGESTRPTDLKAYSLTRLMDDTIAVINATHPTGPVHLIGHDWGSVQSWETATEPAARKYIQSFTSISGPSLDHIGYWMRSAVRSGKPAEISKVLNQLVHSWYIMLFQLPSLPPALWKAWLGKAWPSVLKTVEGIADAPISATQTDDGVFGISLYRQNIIPSLNQPRERRAQVPVQLICATGDHFVSKAMAETAFPWVDELWMREVSTNHWLQYTHGKALARWIDQFVTHIETGRTDLELERYRVTQSASAPRRDFDGKLGVVTGAGSGIGKETALALARNGMTVICTDIDEQAAQATVNQIQQTGGRGFAQRVDVANVDAMEAFASELHKTHGAPDVVVNNAGIGMAGSFLKTQVADWQKILDINLWGVIHGSRLFAQQMIDDAKPGHIVNVASAAAYTPSSIYPAYATTKAAVFMLSDCLRAELGRHDIGVSTICPGLINTNITRTTHFVGEDAATERKKQEKTTQMYTRRAYTPDRVAQEIVDAICKDRAIVPVSPEAKGLRLLSRFAPSVLRAFARYDVTPA
ncbi:Predicted short-chain dehydrogenase [gamma proteobacterium HdN1]|nr:Predicted short-chain dehydrogenase [gamma proteobacterium HdN1]